VGGWWSCTGAAHRLAGEGGREGSHPGPGRLALAGDGGACVSGKVGRCHPRGRWAERGRAVGESSGTGAPGAREGRGRLRQRVGRSCRGGPWMGMGGGSLSSRCWLGGERVAGRGAILGPGCIDKWLFKVRSHLGRFVAWVALSGCTCRSACGLPEPLADLRADLREPRADLRAALRGRSCGPTPPPCPSDHPSREC
jgi:hypothetical protein